MSLPPSSLVILPVRRSPWSLVDCRVAPRVPGRASSNRPLHRKLSFLRAKKTMPALVRVMAMGALCLTAGVRAQSIVPIDEEPQHRLKFQNQHVRLFDVLLPPGYNSLWHYHVYDGVFVNIEASPTREQVLGADAADRAPRIIGETYFLNYAKKPKVHRVTNTGDTGYRVTDTEI